MTIRAHAENRKAMVAAIAEHLGQDYHYDGPPSFNYTVGALTISRDCTITGEQTDLEALKPFLLERGYIEPEIQETVISQNNTQLTVAALTNLTNMLYSKQYLLGRSVGRECIRIPEALIQELQASTPEDVDAFSALLEKYRAEGALAGFDFKDETVSLTFPFHEEEPERAMVYSQLVTRIVQRSIEATRVTPELQRPENEKFFMYGWLMRLGYSGPDSKAARGILMKPLKGYAAFKTAEEMDKHKAKLAAKRLAQREARRAVADNAE